VGQPLRAVLASAVSRRDIWDPYLGCWGTGVGGVGVDEQGGALLDFDVFAVLDQADGAEQDGEGDGRGWGKLETRRLMGHDRQKTCVARCSIYLQLERANSSALLIVQCGLNGFVQAAAGQV
jgi:hypothetical protein